MKLADGVWRMHLSACKQGPVGLASSLQQSRTLRHVLRGLLLIILFTTSGALFAQGYFGTVSGIITDPSGAVVPHTTVTLIDEQKGFQFTATSDNSGRYLFSSIPPGVYSVSAMAPGFDKAVRTNIQLNVSENTTANVQMKVATAKQVVQVQLSGQTLDTEDAVTGQVVDRQFINTLPLVDRYVLDFVGIAPGVSNQSDQNSVSDTGTNFISNGSRGASADILMDGASITNFEPNGGITQVTYTPSAEAVEEFKVQQSNFSAEYGFSGASILNMITRSGTNSFHGSAYDFIRNQITDANNWFNDLYGVPIPPVHRNNYGGTFGGPVLKNKLFFFFDWDGTRASNMKTYQAGVPSTAERTGDFGEICAANGGAFDANGLCSVIAGQLYDPYTGTFQTPADGPAGAYRSAYVPFNNLAMYTSPGNPNLNGTPYQLPNAAGNLIDPVAQKMMQQFPAPNISNGTIYDNWIASGATSTSEDQFDVKIDHRLGEKNLLSAKYSQGWYSQTPFNCFKNFTDPCGGGPYNTAQHLFSINDTYTFGPTLILTSTLGFTRGSELIYAYNKSLNSNPLGTLGFPSYLQTNGFLGVPATFIGGGYYMAGFTSIGQDPYGNYKEGQDTGLLSEVLTKVLGQHGLKFGFEGRLHQQNYIQTNAPVGYFNFDSTGSAQCPTPDITQCGGDGMASFMMGQMVGNGNSYYQIQFEPATQNFQYAAFVQDNWKVLPQLTLNLGLRYDVSLPRTERHNRMNWFDPNAASPLAVPGLATLHGGEVFTNANTRTNWETDWKDIQPRFGFSWQLDSHTVLRGGYGIYFSQTRSGANGLLSYGSQGFTQSTSVVTTYQNDGATPYLHLSNPFPNGLILPPGNSRGLLNDVGYGAIGPLRTAAAARTPYEQSWSLGMEFGLPSNMVFSVQYVGKKGTRLYFTGANNLNVLGPEVENLSPDEIGNLGNYVSNPFASVLTDPYYANSVLSSPTVQAFQLMLPFPQFTSVTTDVPPTANSTYHGLQIVLEKRYSNGLELSANYTWSKSIDDASLYDTNVTWLGNYGPNSGFALQDPNKPYLERSLSTFDVPQQVKVNYTYDLPFGRGKAFMNAMPRAVDLVLGGWKTAGVWSLQSGFPLQFTVENGGTPIYTYGPQRPNLVGTPRRSGGPESNWINNYFADPNVFQIPPAYTLGDTPRAVGSVRSPLSLTNNMSILKDFGLSSNHKEMQFEVRLEAENALNHPIFGTPDTIVGDPNFGVINYTAGTPRQCQLALKLYF